MEEGNDPPHTLGNGQLQQNPVHHTRPFFYVQPPPLPYYMHQWLMYNPYGQFGYPGSGLPFGRPYVSSIPYMQYPGYIIPHAPLHPVEHRRMSNPYIPPPAAYDARFSHGDGRVRRETACSEAQTEPSDGVNKLLEGLGKLGVREAVSCGKPPDPGAVSPDSGVCFREDGEMCARPAEKHVSVVRERPDAPLQPSAAPPDNTMEVARNVESTRSSPKNPARRQEWCVTSGVLPLDGSSVREGAAPAGSTESARICLLAETGPSAGLVDCDQALGVHKHTGCGPSTQSERVVLPSTTRGCEAPSEPSADPAWPLSECLPSHHSPSWLSEAAALLGNGETSKAAPLAGASDVGAARDFEDLPYRILRLPFDKVAPIGLLQEDNPLWCVDQLTTFIPPASYLSSFNNTYYSYYPQTAQERQSILSPSLDELSSRDEMFSTDLEDVDLIPGHVYMAGGEMVDGAGSTEEPPGELALGSSSEEECSVCSRNTCATCGSTLSKTKWRKMHSPGHSSEQGDTDEIGDVYGCERDVPDSLKLPVKKSHVMRRPLPQGRRASRQKPKTGCCEEAEDRAGKYKDLQPRNIQSKLHLGGRWEEGAVASDQESWESCSIEGRPKTWERYHSSHGQETSSRKRPPCKNFGHQRSRRNDPDNEGEFPRIHRGRGMATTRQSLPLGSRGQHAPNRPPDPAEGPHLPQAFCPTPPENQPHPHSRPFFYVQPSQSYVPYQWPIPVAYHPYCGIPSFGYGYGSMVMPPNLYGFPPNPYMEAPGYILPHSQLHLADYRRMLNPQFPPAVAYHARRIRCQHVMVPRETVSSEVQTEPLPQDTSNSQLSATSESCSAETHSLGSDSGKGSGCTNASSSQGSELSTHPGKAESLEMDGDLISTPPQASATPKGAYMFQWDQVQMSAEGSSLDSKTVPSSESVAESAQDASGLLAQCDDSVSSSKGVVPLFSSSANDNTTTVQEVKCDTGGTEQQCAPSYPDILLVSGSPSSGTDPRLEAVHDGGFKTLTEQIATSKLTDTVKVDEEVAEDASLLKEPCFKIVRLPFEMHYMEEVQKVEESVWSVEPLVPCVPSVEWMVQQEFSGAERVEKRDTPPDELSMNQAPASPLENCPATPLSPYLPSASWLADFGNVYYYSKMPPSVQAHLSTFSSSSEPPAMGEKPARDSRGHSAGVRVRKCMHVRGKEGKGCLHLRDHLSHSLENVSGKGERNCPRCRTKADVPPGVRSHRDAHSSAADPKSRTHVSCRCCAGRVLRKGLSPDVSSQSKDEEMENSAPPTTPRRPGNQAERRAEAGGPAPPPPPRRRHSEKCSVKCSKLQEKNCACKEHSGPLVREGNWWRHADGARDNDENVALSSLASDKFRTPERRRTAARRRADASWRETVATMSDREMEVAARRSTPTKHKRQCAHSQEKRHLSKTTALMAHESLPAEDCFSSCTKINTGSYT